MRDFYSGSASRPPFKTAFWKRKQQQQQQQQQVQPLYYEPPRLIELRRENRLKTRKHFPRKKKKQQQWQFRVDAPRNTSSFIMRAKDLGGIASLVSPNPTTPAILATPDMSKAPVYKEGISDEVSKEWGVNGYGSMNGFIRLRPWERRDDTSDSESEVDQDDQHHEQSRRHVNSVQQLETRLDHDLNRFEMVYPAADAAAAQPNLVETRMEDQESHIAHLEEENLTLKERLYVMEQELGELRRRFSRQEELDSMDEQQAEVCFDSDSRPADASYANHN